MVCSVEGCEASAFAAGMCSKHYERKRRHGVTDPGPRARGSLEVRFWRYVRQGASDECWEWQGKSRVAGYGYISLGGRRAGKSPAHRVAYMLANGDIPQSDEFHGHVVMHTCDNRLCCNPAHLRLGTQAENVRDMHRKGREFLPRLRGSSHPNSRFTEDDIRRIRSSELSNVELAREFGCARQVIGGIRRRTTWKHVK